jgi:hypothetical protein
MSEWRTRHPVDLAAIRVGKRRAASVVVGDLSQSIALVEDVGPDMSWLDKRAEYRERARLLRIARAAVRKAAR